MRRLTDTLSIRPVTSRAWRSAGATVLVLALACGGDGSTGPEPQPTPVAVAFVSEPPTVASGVGFPTPITVEIRDASGQRVPTATSGVTLTLIGGPGGAQLSGTATVAASGGVAAFGDLSIEKAGTGFRLVAKASGLAPDTSVSFSVLAGPGARLRFATLPSQITGGLPFGVQPVVQVEDEAGNIVAVEDSISLSLSANPAAGTLSGVNAMRSSAGVAVFSGLSIDRAGVGYVLTATAPGLQSASSGSFSVLVGPPSPNTSTLSIDYSVLELGDTLLITLTTRDAGGNVRSSGGFDVQVFGPSTLGPSVTVDHQDGTYSLTAIPSGATPTGIEYPLALIGGVPVTTPAPAITILMFREVSAGVNHTCARAHNGQAYCWGKGASGQLGTGEAADTTDPVRVVGGPIWAAVVAGGDYTCGLTTTGEGRCWGRNAHGVLGGGQPDTGPESDEFAPTAVSGGLSLRRIRVSHSGTACAVANTFLGYCWGRNDRGQVGDSSMSDRAVPTLVAGGHFLNQIAPGEHHSCAVEPLTALCWGSDSAGALGDGGGPQPWSCGGQPCSLAPVPVLGLVGHYFGDLDGQWEGVSTGSDHACAMPVTQDGYCWGGNGSSQLGDGSTSPRDSATVLSGVVEISAGDQFSCGISSVSTDALLCWGANDFGQLGTGSQTPTATPTPVGLVAKSVEAGARHVCAVDSHSWIYCWGDNSSGQVGDGTHTMRLSPARVRFRQ